MAASALSAKLDLVLKALTMSRGRLAAEMGVDKSLVGRWVAGSVKPSSHNLALLTALIARKRPGGFTLLDWERDMDGLAELFGVDLAALPASPAPGPAPAGGGLFPFASEAMNARETVQTGHHYPGHYAVFHQSVSRNDGTGLLMVAHVFFQGERLAAVWSSPVLRIDLNVLILRDRPWFLGESNDARSGLFMAVFNGAGMNRAMVMDGLITATAGDRFQTISASKALMIRVADSLDDPADDAALHAAMVRRLEGQSLPELSARLLPAAYAHVIDNAAGFTRADAPDHVLRAPVETSVSISDVGAASADFVSPELTAFFTA